MASGVDSGRPVALGPASLAANGQDHLFESAETDPVSPKWLSELEKPFESERDQRRIDSMRKNIGLVRRRAALDEQARLKAPEAGQLKRDAAKKAARLMTQL